MNKIMGAAAALLLMTGAALAGEHPIGEPVERDGMRVGAVYLQGVMMEPMDHAHGEGDIHLEADIHALKNNPNGFAAGEWIPNLGVSFELTKKDDASFSAKGDLVPMVANDGPHYGLNVKMGGPGKYHLVFHVTPPSEHGFYRHVDKETGVKPWWSAFDQAYDFTYVGSTGKKGGY